MRLELGLGSSPSSIQPRCGSTGPPIQRRRSLPPSMGGSSRTMLVAGMSVGRLITRPNAPSGVKSHSSTTVLAKFGSCSWGIDSSSAGRNGSDIAHSSSAATRFRSPTKRRISARRRLFVRRAKDRRGVDGRHHARRERRGHERAPLLRDLERAAEQRLRRRRAEADDARAAWPARSRSRATAGTRRSPRRSASRGCAACRAAPT